MNNNGMNFDPQTGQPINNNGVNFNPQTGQSVNNNGISFNQQMEQSLNDQNNGELNQQPAQQSIQNNALNSQPANNGFQQVNVPVQNDFPQTTNVNTTSNTEIGRIPTVEQNSESFISNTQNISSEKVAPKKKGVNYLLIIILFLAIFAAIFFLFPILKNYI